MGLMWLGLLGVILWEFLQEQICTVSECSTVMVQGQISTFFLASHLSMTGTLGMAVSHLLFQ